MGTTFEILLVEDSSPDASWAEVLCIAAGDSRVRGLRLGRNFGQHNALLCGIRAAKGDVIVTLDDDLQHPPEEIPKLLRGLSENVDVVYGKHAHTQHDLGRNVTVGMAKYFLKYVMGIKNADSVGAFRAFRTRLRLAFDRFESPYVSVDVLLSWATDRFDAVVVDHQRRPHGKSNYSLAKLIQHTLNLLSGFSTAPLRLASWVGLSAMLLGVGVLIYVIVRFFTIGQVVPGFAFIASIISIFSGTQLFALGIIGEYLARMHSSSLRRPPYVVAETT